MIFESLNVTTVTLPDSVVLMRRVAMDWVSSLQSSGTAKRRCAQFNGSIFDNNPARELLQGLPAPNKRYRRKNPAVSAAQTAARGSVFSSGAASPASVDTTRRRPTSGTKITNRVVAA